MTAFKASHLQAHPEGGHFREVYRSPQSVTHNRSQEKSALTHIYFLLKPDEHSCFHRVEQEEIWNLYRGEGLRLWILDPETRTLSSHLLSAENNCFCAVVPAGHWQATEPLGSEVLAGCTVAPGFEFSDFALMSGAHALAETVRDASLGHLLPSS